MAIMAIMIGTQWTNGCTPWPSRDGNKLFENHATSHNKPTNMGVQRTKNNSKTIALLDSTFTKHMGLSESSNI